MSFQLKLERRHRLSTPSSKQLNSLWLHMLQGLPCTSAANAKHSGEAFPIHWCFSLQEHHSPTWMGRHHTAAN